MAVPASSQPSTSTLRLEAFSDGVFAIAVTLLVLDLKVPVGEGHLGHDLARLWPAYAAYAVSFATIGIIWVNHHAMFERIVSADRGLMLVNLVLLLWVSVIPFPTSVLAEHLRAQGDQHVAAAVYCAVLLLMGAGFFATFTYARVRGLLAEHLSPAMVRFLALRNLAGQVVYVVALGVAFVSAPVSLALCALVAVYYLLPEHILRPPA